MLILTWMLASQPAHTALLAQGQLQAQHRLHPPILGLQGSPWSMGSGQILPEENTQQTEKRQWTAQPQLIFHEGNRRHNLFSGYKFISP